MRGTCTTKGIAILCGETFVCHCFRKIAAHTLILYNFNSLTDNLISLHLGWVWTSCANSFLTAWGYRWEWGNMRRKDRVIKCLGTRIWQQNRWVMCIINRAITNAYGGHVRRLKRPDLNLKCRSAVTAHRHNSHLYTSCSLLWLFKKSWPQISGLHLSEEKRNNSIWTLVVFCFNCNGRQTKVHLEMLDLSSSLNRVPIPTAWMPVTDYIYTATSQRKAMGTTCRIVSYSGTPCVFFQLSTASEHTKNKTALSPPYCHSPL